MEAVAGYMEVNEYLLGKLRVLSFSSVDKIESENATTPFDGELERCGLCGAEEEYQDYQVYHPRRHPALYARLDCALHGGEFSGMQVHTGKIIEYHP